MIFKMPLAIATGSFLQQILHHLLKGESILHTKLNKRQREDKKP